MPIYNIVTKEWTYDVDQQTRYGCDEDGNNLIYMDDEENNFGKEYEYESEEEYEVESEDSEESDSDFYKEIEEISKTDTPTQQSNRQAELRKELLSLLK